MVTRLGSAARVRRRGRLNSSMLLAALLLGMLTLASLSFA
jgi:hypothetical protein